MRAGSSGTAATLSRDASGDGIPTNLSSMIANLIGILAFVAQPVERFLGKEEAGGSNPPEGFNNTFPFLFSTLDSQEPDSPPNAGQGLFVLSCREILSLQIPSRQLR